MDGCAKLPPSRDSPHHRSIVLSIPSIQPSKPRVARLSFRFNKSENEEHSPRFTLNLVSRLLRAKRCVVKGPTQRLRGRG